MKNIVVLGSTGSIGVQTLNVIERLGAAYKVVGLSADTNAGLLALQAKKFHVKTVALTNAGAYASAKNLFGSDVKVLSGPAALEELASIEEADLVVVSVVGMCGLKAVMAALRQKKQVALANKESLVAGGQLVMDAAKSCGKEILPIDSEHSAVWQCLRSGDKRDLRRIILTASGGPFYDRDIEFLKKVKPEQAVKHPNWNMGKKISVDSATMMNKGLEIIEARWLFSTLNIDYIIHRQSVIHSMVQFNDGSVIAHLSKPNMELPIQEALTFPRRGEFHGADLEFDFTLEFLKPDEDKFPLPKLCRQAMLRGGDAPCAINAANEACVNLFLNNRIAFTDINCIIEKTMNGFKEKIFPSIGDIYDTYDEVYGKLMRDYNN